MHTGRIRAELARAGTPIGPYDQMIAGHARSRGLIAVTANPEEFRRVSGISIEDWTAADPPAQADLRDENALTCAPRLQRIGNGTAPVRDGR